MKTCTIIGGIDGVGKSSLLGVLRAVRTDLGVLVDEKEIAASEHIETALKDGISFSYETTLHGEFSKEPRMPDTQFGDIMLAWTLLMKIFFASRIMQRTVGQMLFAKRYRTSMLTEWMI